VVRGPTARNCAASSASLGKSDVLTVTRLDRLARSTRDLLNTLATITAKGAGFRSLNDTWADTTTAHGRLMLTVLGGLDRLLMVLLSDARHVVVASSNALVSGAARDFHDQRNGAGRNECRFPAVAVDLFLHVSRR
jgi:hypothetical protein